MAKLKTNYQPYSIWGMNQDNELIIYPNRGGYICWNLETSSVQLFDSWCKEFNISAKLVVAKPCDDTAIHFSSMDDKLMFLLVVENPRAFINKLGAFMMHYRNRPYSDMVGVEWWL